MRWRGQHTLCEPGWRPWHTREGASKARSHWALRPGPPAHWAVSSSTLCQLAADRDKLQPAQGTPQGLPGALGTGRSGILAPQVENILRRGCMPYALAHCAWGSGTLGHWPVRPAHWAWGAHRRHKQGLFWRRWRTRETGPQGLAHYKGRAAGPGTLAGVRRTPPWLVLKHLCVGLELGNRLVAG